MSDLYLFYSKLSLSKINFNKVKIRKLFKFINFNKRTFWLSIGLPLCVILLIPFSILAFNEGIHLSLKATTDTLSQGTEFYFSSLPYLSKDTLSNSGLQDVLVIQNLASTENVVDVFIYSWQGNNLHQRKVIIKAADTLQLKYDRPNDCPKLQECFYSLKVKALFPIKARLILTKNP